MEEGTILTWLKKDGDVVAVGEELVEIEVDKATTTYAAEAQGVLRILAAQGVTLNVGALMARVDADAEPGSAKPTSELVRASAPARSSIDGAAPEGSQTAGVPATPLARRIASEHHVDLTTVEGSGPGGRITKADVAASAGIELRPLDRVASSAHELHQEHGSAGSADASSVQKLTRHQRAMARRMTEAKATIPDFQVQTEVCLDALVALRAQLKEPDPTAHVPSLNDFIVKASALALRKHPRTNGSYSDGNVVLHSRVNVGIAVATDEALVVPTIFDADSRSLGEIALESRRLATRVRTGDVTPSELSGATFTVSNLGMYGMTAITPIINPPQAAILGAGALRQVACPADGTIRVRQLMTFTLSCDHRILTGADAAQFLTTICSGIGHPLTLML